MTTPYNPGRGVTRVARDGAWQRRGRPAVQPGGSEPNPTVAPPVTALDRWLAPVDSAAYWGFYPGTNSTTTVDAMETAAGRLFDLSKMTYTLSSTAFPSTQHLAKAPARCLQVTIGLRSTGAYSSLLPAPGDPTNNVWKYSQVIDGDLDVWLHWLAGQLKAIPNPFLLEFNPWPENPDNVYRTSAFSDPAWFSNRAATSLAYRQTVMQEYADAVRRIRAVFRAEGVSQAIFMQTFGDLGAAGPDIDPLYGPLYAGDAAVDVIGWAPVNSTVANWQTPVQKFGAGYYALTFYKTLSTSAYPSDLAPTKPFMLSDYGSVADPADASRRTAWLGLLSDAMASFPQIKALSYLSTGVTDIHDVSADAAAFNSEGGASVFTATPPTS